jgi:DNA-binding transcriptional LysR family regulator
MDLNHLSTFARVVHDGSFTAAAQTLGLPKSSVSRSVAQLEQQLGIRLLHRTTRKLHLTEAGTAFYDRIAQALSDIEEARATAADMQAELRGTVRVTAPPDMGVFVLAPIVTRFVRRHPAIHVDLSLTGRLVDLVSEGFDLAVRAGPLRDSSLVARRVGAFAQALFASPRYLARKGAPETVPELAAHDCVLFRAKDGRSVWSFVNKDDARQSIEVVGAITVDDFAFVRTALLAGAGIGTLPEFLCARDEEKGRLVRVLPAWRTIDEGVIHIVYPSARFVPQRVVVFRDVLLHGLGKLSQTCEAHRRGDCKAPKQAAEAGLSGSTGAGEP